MKKLIAHIELWYEWQKNCLNNPFYNFMVLLGVCHSPTFSVFMEFKKLQLAHPDMTIHYHDGEMKDNTRFSHMVKLLDLEKELP